MAMLRQLAFESLSNNLQELFPVERDLQESTALVDHFRNMFPAPSGTCNDWDASPCAQSPREEWALLFQSSNLTEQQLIIFTSLQHSQDCLLLRNGVACIIR